MIWTFGVTALALIAYTILIFKLGNFLATKEFVDTQTKLNSALDMLTKEYKLLAGTLDVANENSKRYQLICHILENQTPLCLEIGYNGKLLTTALELDLVLDGIIDIHESQQLVDFLTALKKGLE
jgi:hypothetical protein